MNRILISVFLTALLQGCSVAAIESQSDTVAACIGSVALPAAQAAHFDAIEDSALLASSIAEPEQGRLCQGSVYQAKEHSEVKVYRAWNSTNPDSKFGQWWAFSQPAGTIAAYRENYEICYQWSPLDKMVKCTLKPGARVVVGTGQSAKCSNYLSYPVSDSQQVYIEDSQYAVVDCEAYDGIMHWQPE